MASKKGISITIGILGAITAASFLAWSIPQTYETSFVVSDFENHLDGVQNIHSTISEDLDENLQKLVDGSISPEEYIQAAETSTSQINSQIIQIVESSPTEEWQESYINYMESLKQSNTYIRETIVFANMIKDGVEEAKLDEALDSANQLKSDVQNLIDASSEARP